MPLLALRINRKKEKLLPSVRPNPGLQAWYRGRLLRMIDEMHASVTYWLKASYRANEPEMAADATPAAELQKTIARMAKKWQQGFDKGALDLAVYFAKSTVRRTDAQLKKILKDAGFTVELRMTAAQRDIVQATVAENVKLISSLPQQYLLGVTNSVMQSVKTGRDIGGLAKELEEKWGIARRRAQGIARDQNNKATSALNQSRQLELGIEEAVWMHSHAGRVPRPTHVANDGKRYNVRTGWYDPHERRHIQPGELIKCRCTSRSVIPGFI